MRLQTRVALILLIFLTIQTLSIHHNLIFAQGFWKDIYSSTLVTKGIKYKAEGDHVAAISKFSKSIKTEPNNLEADYQLGLILEEVLHYYDDAISLYKNVISLSKVLKPPGSEEELKRINTLVANAKESIDKTIKKKFDSLEEPKLPVYIQSKSNKKILISPKAGSKSIYKTTSNNLKEFALEGFSDDWYQITIPSVGSGWIRGKDILEIVPKEDESKKLRLEDVIANYKDFARLHSSSGFIWDVQKKIEDLSYDLSKKKNTVNSYSSFIEEFPVSHFVLEAKQRIDRMNPGNVKEEDTIDSSRNYSKATPEETKNKASTLELPDVDKETFSDVEGLKDWIDDNKESPFLGKATSWVDELTFAQAKFDNNIASLERYIKEYPQGTFVVEAKQLIEGLRREHEDIKVVEGYEGEDILDRILDDEYAGIEDTEKKIAAEKIVAEEPVKPLDSNEEDELAGIVEARVETLSFKKAMDEKDPIDAIKLHEEYLLKYPYGMHTNEAKAKIEELSYSVAVSENTIEGHNDFIRDFPKSKHNQEITDKIIDLTFREAKLENNLMAYGQFLDEYPDSKHSNEVKDIIEELAFNNAKESGTLAAFKAFVNIYPDSVYVQETNSMIEYLAFKDSIGKENINDIEEFVRKYHESEYVEEAKYKVDQLRYESYRKKDNIRAYRDFIKKYPESSFIEEANLKIDQLNYDYYKKKDNVKAYRKFITKYPENKYVDEAKQIVAQLLINGEQKEDGSKAPVMLIIYGILGIGVVLLVVLKHREIIKILKVWKWREQDTYYSTSTPISEHLKKYLFMTTVLTYITQEESFKEICAIALRAVAITIMIAGITVWGINWYHVVSLPIAALTGGVIFQLIYIVAIYMAVHILFVRANDIVELPEFEYPIIPIVSVFLQVIGEIFAFFIGAMSFGIGILAWIAGDYSGSIIKGVAPFLSTYSGGTVVEGILIILCGVSFAFCGLVIFYLLSGLIFIASAIFNNTKAMR